MTVAGALDYPDFQSGILTAAPPIVEQQAVAIAPDFDSGVLAVGNWPGLFVILSPTVRACRLRLNWYAKSDGTEQLDFVIIDVDATFTLAINVRNRGPFVRVQVQSQSGLGATITCIAMPSGINGQVIGLQGLNYIFQARNTSVAAGATGTQSYAVPWWGPAYWHITSTAAAWTAEIRATDVNGNISEVATVDNLDTGNRQGVVNLPPLILTHRVTNNDGVAQTFTWSVIPAYTV